MVYIEPKNPVTPEQMENGVLYFSLLKIPIKEKNFYTEFVMLRRFYEWK